MYSNSASWFKYSVLVWAFAFCPERAWTMQGQQDRNDPYIRTVYQKAFKQDDIWKKYRKVLQTENLNSLLETQNLSLIETYAPESIQPKGCFSCFENPYFKSIRNWIYSRTSEYIPLQSISDEGINESEDDSELSFEELRRQAFALNQALVNRFLENKRNDALQDIKDEVWSTATYSAISAGILGGAAVIMPASTIGMGTGFGAYAIASHAAYVVHRSVKDFIRLKNYSSDPLLQYEIQYAIYKRFLPSSLWEVTEAKFAFARTNPFSQSQYLKFFEILFKLPREKKSFLLTPPDTFASSDKTDLDSKLKYTYDRLVMTIDELFGNEYVDSEEIKLELKTSLWEHINASIGRSSAKRNLFLVGPPGVGKTRMIEKIQEEIKIPVIPLNLGLVRDPSDLFGSEEKPGYLLEALASCEYTNPLLLTDEAGETFNNPAIVPSLKILLEPQLGRFDSPFLKASEVNIRDLLWVSLSNSKVDGARSGAGVTKEADAQQQDDQVEDANALASRLRTVRFPSLSADFISRKANELAPKMLANYVYVKEMKDISSQDEVDLKAIIARSRTVRDLQNLLPTWCMKVNENRRRQVYAGN